MVEVTKPVAIAEVTKPVAMAEVTKPVAMAEVTKPVAMAVTSALNADDKMLGFYLGLERKIFNLLVR